MKCRLLAVAVSLLTGSLAFAQGPPPPAVVLPNQQPAMVLPGQQPAVVLAEPVAEPRERFYSRNEAILWWLSNAPNPTPLLATGNPAVDPNAGILGAPSTVVLFGARDIGLGMFAGGRFTAGYWFGSDGLFGLEGVGTYLAQQNRGFAAASNAAGTPLLVVPFQNGAGQESRFLIANPGIAPPSPLVGVGSYTANYSTQLVGAEANAQLRFPRDLSRNISLIAGFSYRRLSESMNLNYTLLPVTAAPGVTFGGTALDAFATTNDFFGGQIGARWGRHFDRLFFDVTTKVAFGAVNQTVAVAGASTFNGTFGPPFNAASPYGVFAQTSNIGTQSRSRFTVIPEFTLNAGYELTRNVKFLVGYNLVYWNGVVRPGMQIDRVINTRAGGPGNDHFFTGLQRDVPPLGGRPGSRFAVTDLVAQGINIGLEFAF